MYIGNECFLVNGREINLTVSDFWRWAYSDLTNNINRSVFAEFIVASAIGSTSLESDEYRRMWRPYDLLSPSGRTIEVKSAAYVQSWDIRHPDHISFRIAPARLPDDKGDYRDDAPKQRNAEVYVFCIFKATQKEQSPLDMELWDFYALSTKILDREKPTQKTITLPSLMELKPVWSDYYGLPDAIEKALSAV